MVLSVVDVEIATSTSLVIKTELVRVTESPIGDDEKSAELLMSAKVEESTPNIMHRIDAPINCLIDTFCIPHNTLVCPFRWSTIR